MRLAHPFAVVAPVAPAAPGRARLSVWMAFAAANHARRQIETRVRDVGAHPQRG